MPIRLGRLTSSALFAGLLNRLAGRDGRTLATRDGYAIAWR